LTLDLATVRAELEDELTWRLDELKFFKNRLSDIHRDDDRKRYRRALVVMLYSHFEGFWKAAFVIYAKAVNRTGIRCKDASEALVASAFADVFEALADGNRKSDYFRRSAPDDSQLHRFSRHQEFVGLVDDFVRQVVAIELENAVDTESNLKPVVIRKNLFRLGFQHDAFSAHEGTVNRLLETRNQIAHGATRSGLSQSQYEPLEQAVIHVMQTVVLFIYEALTQERYMRRKAAEYAI
jgi:hypothetical protein